MLIVESTMLTSQTAGSSNHNKNIDLTLNSEIVRTLKNLAMFVLIHSQCDVMVIHKELWSKIGLNPIIKYKKAKIHNNILTRLL